MKAAIYSRLVALDQALKTLNYIQKEVVRG